MCWLLSDGNRSVAQGDSTAQTVNGGETDPRSLDFSETALPESFGRSLRDTRRRRAESHNDHDPQRIFQSVDWRSGRWSRPGYAQVAFPLMGGPAPTSRETLAALGPVRASSVAPRLCRAPPNRPFSSRPRANTRRRNSCGASLRSSRLSLCRCQLCPRSSRGHVDRRTARAAQRMAADL